MTTRTLAWIGLAAQVLFTAYWLVAALWQGPRYDPVLHSISDMYAVTAPAGIAMVVVVTLCGAGTLAFVLLGLLPVLRRRGVAGVIGAVLLALSIFGVGDLLTPFERLACRLADPGCTPAGQVANLGGTLDATLSTIGVMLLIAAGFTIFGALPKGDRLRAPLLVLTILVAVCFAGLAVGVLPGLVERLLALFGAALIGVTAAVVLGSPARAAAPVIRAGRAA